MGKLTLLRKIPWGKIGAFVGPIMLDEGIYWIKRLIRRRMGDRQHDHHSESTSTSKKRGAP